MTPVYVDRTEEFNLYDSCPSRYAEVNNDGESILNGSDNSSTDLTAKIKNS